MILVAGGQLDPNLDALLRRMRQRRVKLVEVLVGPKHVPKITVDLRSDKLRVNGRAVRPAACFMRHDVFLQQTVSGAEAQAAALNWYAAVKGWELAHDDVKGFNKKSVMTEHSKLLHLVLAKSCGLAVPDTIVTNDFLSVPRLMAPPLIQKPAAGGEYTTLFDDLRPRVTGNRLAAYPRFIQTKLARPELRIYRVGDEYFAFSLSSRDIDYRTHNRAKLKLARAPAELLGKLHALCEAIGLDFAAADFMRDKRAGALCFLEVNSQPMFAAFDLVAGGRICDAIIDHLS
jgi:glutathione synthase/RimK-type ligase-like ATP-grasp enzyme